MHKEYLEEKYSEKEISNYIQSITDNSKLSDLTKKKKHVINELNKIKSDSIDIKNVSVYKKSNKTNIIILVNTKEKLKLFNDYVIFFYIDSFFLYNYYNKKHCYLSLDFEFDGKKVALLQLNFDNTYSNYIFILNPNELTNDEKHIFRKYCLTNHFIIKIMHGSESMDLPYIVYDLLNNDILMIHKFIKSLIDTRFICEYLKFSHKYYHNVDNDNKTSLYIAIHEAGVIDDDQYEKFLNLYKKMGPIQDIAWEIGNLGKAQLEYAYNDVVYLKYLYKAIFRLAKEDKRMFEGLKYTIEFMRLVCLEKYGVTNIISKAKIESDAFNINMIYKQGKLTNIINIYDEVIIKYVLQNNIDINTFFGITFIKKTCTTLFKYIIYDHLIKNRDVYKDKKNQNKQKLNSSLIYDEINRLKLKKLLELLLLVGEAANDKLEHIL
jgi:hypothetical protein